MKYCIDEQICSKYDLSLDEMLAILLLKATDDVDTLINNMLKKEILVEENNTLFITQPWDDKAMNALLDSEKVNADTENRELEELAKQLMELFPKGKKDGTNVYWRGNLKDNKLRLKKFFKLYGDKYSFDEILKAAQDYVSSFNGNYQYMRVLKYFIWKDAKKTNAEGVNYIEESSELATLIENKDQPSNDDWVDDVL